MFVVVVVVDDDVDDGDDDIDDHGDDDDHEALTCTASLCASLSEDASDWRPPLLLNDLYHTNASL